MDLHFSLKPHHENALINALEASGLGCQSTPSIIFLYPTRALHSSNPSLKQPHRHVEKFVRTVSYPLPAELHGHVPTVANDSDISTNQNALRIAPPEDRSDNHHVYGTDPPWENSMYMCNLFLKPGSHAVSILVATGDGLSTGPKRLPRRYPFAGPAVDGTTRDDLEVATSLSGEGFSNYSPLPDYEKLAIVVSIIAAQRTSYFKGQACARLSESLGVRLRLVGLHDYDITSGLTPAAISMDSPASMNEILGPEIQNLQTRQTNWSERLRQLL
ncbi:hypothetical protein V8E53_010601 [Lactarius tabidus]